MVHEIQGGSEQWSSYILVDDYKEEEEGVKDGGEEEEWLLDKPTQDGVDKGRLERSSRLESR